MSFMDGFASALKSVGKGISSGANKARSGVSKVKDLRPDFMKKIDKPFDKLQDVGEGFRSKAEGYADKLKGKAEEYQSKAKEYVGAAKDKSQDLAFAAKDKLSEPLNKIREQIPGKPLGESQAFSLADKAEEEARKRRSQFNRIG